MQSHFLRVSVNASLTLSSSLIQSCTRLFSLSRPLLLTFCKPSAPVSQTRLCMDFNHLSGMNVLAV